MRFNKYLYKYWKLQAAGIPSLNLIAPNIVLLILFYLKERQNSSIEKIKDHSQREEKSVLKFWKEVLHA